MSLGCIVHHLFPILFVYSSQILFPQTTLVCSNPGASELIRLACVAQQA